MNCNASSLASAARCFCGFSNREVAAISTYLLCGWANGTNPIVQEWAQTIIDSGGEPPSRETQDALDVFLAALESAGILSKMIAVNCVVPDSLTAAITPIISNAGNNPWTNVNFVDADLGPNGLLGANTKYLNTGVIPTVALPSDTEGGLSFYNLTASNLTYQEMGSLSNVASRMMLSASWGGNCYWDCWDTGTGRQSPANGLWTGFVSGSRTAANDFRVYRANGSVGFQEIGSSGLTGGTRPSHSIFAFAYNNAGTPASYAVKRLSFLAVHHGLNPTETESLYDAVQALRTTLGGGFV